MCVQSWVFARSSLAHRALNIPPPTAHSQPHSECHILPKWEKLIYFPLTLFWRKSKTDSHKMTAIFPGVDKSSLSRTFSFHFWQQRWTWSATCKDSLGLGRGACNSHCPYAPPAAAETTRKGVQSEKHMVICGDVDEPRIHHMEWSKSESGKQMSCINAYMWNLEKWRW